ncbi:hypothetical protein ACX0G7_26845 [Flavitalea antarctica]
MNKLFCIVFALWLAPEVLFSQNTSTALDRITDFPQQFFSKVQKKSARLEENIVAATDKTLMRLERQEARLKRKLSRKDSLAAQRIFGDVQQKYSNLKTTFNQPAAGSGEYNAYLDTLKTTLKFLSTSSTSSIAGNNLISEENTSHSNQKISSESNRALASISQPSVAENSLQRIKGLETKLNQADVVRKYLQNERAKLKEELQKFGLAKQFSKYNKEAYYYSEQIQEYKRILQDPDRLERKALSMLHQIPAVKNFMSRNSELARLFPQPAGYGSSQALQGLQTRSSVQQIIQTQIGQALTGSNGDNLAQTTINPEALMRQSLQQAKSAFESLKERITKAGGNNSDFDLPGFKPNTQKKKTFFERLEFGTNLQSTKSNAYWPVTTDIGLAVGYKLNDKAVIGIGGSYKIGWGKDIRNIVITHEGLSIRSFLDVKLKGTFYITGGYEQNYRRQFANLTQLKGINNWQQSGLLGISKIVSIKSKFFKKTKIQLLWDMLSYQQIPKEQPLKFRLGYNF